jgi:hypothetical protein
LHGNRKPRLWQIHNWGWFLKFPGALYSSWSDKE